jgi:short-subunit dehydrogenase
VVCEKEVRRMQSGGGEYALITGASSGIGRELARPLATEGLNVVLVARDDERLRRLAAEIERDAGVTARLLPKDLRAQDAPSEIFSEMEADGVDVAVLVNNAGTCVYDEFCESDLDAEIDMIQVNVTALTCLTKLFLPKMLTRGSGRILNVASGAGLCPVPLVAAYAATKAYVVSLSESLAHELRGTGVSVTCLCPWPTESGIQESSGLGASRAHRRKLADAADVARIGLAACKRRDVIAIPGPDNRLLVFAMRFAPRTMNTRVSAWMFERV